MLKIKSLKIDNNIKKQANFECFSNFLKIMPTKKCQLPKQTLKKNKKR